MSIRASCSNYFFFKTATVIELTLETVILNIFLKRDDTRELGLVELNRNQLGIYS